MVQLLDSFVSERLSLDALIAEQYVARMLAECRVMLKSKLNEQSRFRLTNSAIQPLFGIMVPMRIH